MFTRVCLVIVVLLLPLTARATDSAVPAGYQYYYFDEPVPLYLDTTCVALHATGSDSASTLRAAAARVGFSADTLRPHTLAEWWVASTPADRRDELSVKGLVAALAEDKATDFVSPVFLDLRGQPVIITPYVLVRFRPDVPADKAEAILSSAGGRVEQAEFGGMERAYRVRMLARDGFTVLDTANALALLPDVEWAEPDKLIQGVLYFIPNDPGFSSQWGLHNTGQAGGTVNMDIDAPQAWDITTGSSSIEVAVLDLGVQLNHPDLAANLIDGYDATGNGTGGGPLNSCDNHGTEVAGCIVALTNNSLGVASVAPGCRVQPIKIGVANVPCNGYFSALDSYLVNGLDWARTQGARVTNSSFGWGVSSAVTSAYNTTYNYGLVHFAASGNDGASSISYPASLDSVNAVGALNRYGNRASFSNYGTGLAFSAPGVDIYTTDRTGSAGDASGDYVWVDGTSFASPYAAGVGALVLSRNSALTPSQVSSVIAVTCRDRGATGYDTIYGWGFVNAYNAVSTMGNPPQPFNLLTPSNGATAVSTTPTFTWSTSTNATSYTLQVATDPNFALPTVNQTGITSTSYTLSGNGLQEETLYYWRVIAVSSVGSQVSTPPYRYFTTWRDCDDNGQDDFQQINANPALDCNGNGWLDVCDIASGMSLDCNQNNVPDECDQASCGGQAWCSDCNNNGVLDACDLATSFQVMSPEYTPLGTPTVHTLTLIAPPDAQSSVLLSFTAYGDINGTNEYVDVAINGTPVGTVYQASGYFSCVANQADSLTVPASTYNALKASGGGNVSISLTPSVNVNPTECGSNPTTIRLTVSYSRQPASSDSNGNGVPDECETGACCYPNGSCSVLLQSNCISGGGTYQGNGTTCSPNPCPQPTGACCYADGSCVVRTQVECNGTGGAYQGNGTSCSPNPCPQPTGACCYADGSCVVRTQAECGGTGGTYQGNGTSCSPNPCPQPTGACCYADGSCVVRTQTECTGTGGTYQGNGTTCSPNPCPQPAGACCYTDGSCAVSTEAECVAGNGTYQGDGVSCSPNPCPPALCPGDTNCDGGVTFADIDYFVEALAGEEEWTHWPCPWLNADCTGDGEVTFADIDPFVALIGTTCP